MRRFLSALFLLFFLGLPIFTGSAQVGENREFTVSRGDTLVVRNDFGGITVRGVDGRQARVRITFDGAPDSRKENFVLVAEKQQDTIRIEFFSVDGASRPVQLDIEAPVWMDVMIWGDQPRIYLKDLRGRVRAQTRAGSIQTEDIGGPTSLSTDLGMIEYHSAAQPLDDINLNTWAGEIRCRLNPALNLRALLRSGSRITWASEVDTRQGSLERELGGGGPLLYASSRNGNVAVTLDSPSPQTAPAAASEAIPPSNYVIRIDSSRVYLNVSVKDSLSGETLAGLKKDDFLVYEDGALQSPDHFESAESPFHLLLLLDMSGSTRDHLGIIKSAATEFVQKTRVGDRVAVATFSTTARLVQGFTRTREQAAQAIRNISPGGGTALYDALMDAVTKFLAGIEGRKAIVVFSDGLDNQLLGNSTIGSRHSFDDLLRRIRETDCLIYPIFLYPDYHRSSGVMSGAQSNPFSVVDQLSKIANRRADPAVQAAQEIVVKAESQLRALADQTGGRMYAPKRVEDLALAYEQVIGDIRIQYTLGYYPPSGAKGQWRNLKVRVRDHPLATVRTRSGYLHLGN